MSKSKVIPDERFLKLATIRTLFKIFTNSTQKNLTNVRHFDSNGCERYKNAGKV